jgi:hypothetical protein
MAANTGTTRERSEETATAARETAAAAEHGADQAVSAVGAGMETLAGQIRQKAPQQGVLASAAPGVAERLETGGRYLEHHGVRDMDSDFTDVIRRYPMTALCIGFCVGFLAGRALTRR